MYALVLSGYSGLAPQSKDMYVSLMSDSRLAVGVSGCLETPGFLLTELS